MGRAVLLPGAGDGDARAASRGRSVAMSSMAIQVNPKLMSETAAGS